ncbi:phosphatidate cytidylyltransferase [Microlunatus capsulatus]|uniref:Phosphatidate cytidylyltransferase n=1 Tax=Microlunatus capsulatus TaxID=99117 RepID=A0ABS4ZCR8_9ACTN|nr:phosphatidate cytidylyltransferase [Microlunatus capsulatus]
MTGTPAPPPTTGGGGGAPTAPGHGRAGRNLPQALAVGLGLGAYVVLTLVFWRFGFVLLIALALALASVELYNALRRVGMRAAVVPIVIGSVAIAIGSYLAGRQSPVVFSTTSVLLAALALTVIASLVWRMRGGAEGYVRDTAASMLIIAYVPLLGSFAALILAAPEDGVARMILFLLVVVMNDTGGYVAGVLFGKHPMAPRISPKKSWEGFAGSMLFGIVSAVLMAVYGLEAPVWVGVLLGVCLVAVGTCGDLVESLIKRDLGIKDMSSFLPGHGGVMDRLDSLLISAPVAWLIMYVLVPGG